MNILDIINAISVKIKKRLPIIIILSLLVGAVTGFIIKQKPTSYIATSTIFPLSANSAMGSSSPISQLQQQFGIKSESGNDIYDINELINSKKLSFKVVNANPTSKKYNKLYKWLVDDHNSELAWRADPIKLSEDKKDTLRNLIIGRSLLIGRVEVEQNKNGYTSLRVRAYDKELAKEINENILLALSNFYIDFVTEKPRTDLRRIQSMRDSLGMELSQVTRAIAGVVDKSAFATKAYVGLPQIKLKRKQAEIEAVYSTTVSALQNARFKLLSESPIFQVLDHPGEPYGVEKEDWKPKAAIATVLMIILLSLWFCRKIFKSIIIEELKKV